MRNPNYKGSLNRPNLTTKLDRGAIRLESSNFLLDIGTYAIDRRPQTPRPPQNNRTSVIMQLCETD